MSVLWCALCLAAGVAVVSGAGCELAPGEGAGAKSPGDNFYRLVVNGDVERYAPGQRYVVTLVGSRTHDVVQQFTRFKLSLQPLSPAPPVRGHGAGAGRLGEFQLFADTLSRFDERCAGAVLEADDLPKTEVQVMWKAPPAGSGCVLLKAMVSEGSGRWFAEDGQLTRRVCEDTSLSASGCCACDDAKYKLVFEGLWSAQTHPKDFPTQALWLTHFSDLIGATHTGNFSFWGEGQLATDGFRSLAEWGSVGLLERELRQRGGGELRAIVKAPGLWHPRVNANTTATFTVDRRRHKLSIASMFGPSPDWVVGVSGLELCRADCTWTRAAAVDLRPYDAGTDNGVSYMSPNAESRPRERMYRITPMYPEDPRAPFYSPGARDVPPLARLHLIRDRLVSRPCGEDVLQALLTEEAEDAHEVDRPECVVGAWGAWSACSVSCGKGLRMRTRAYRMPQKAQMLACDRQLVGKEMCVADVPECEGAEESELLPEDSGLSAGVGVGEGVCETTEWGAWSECSVTCGVGVNTRRRQFIDRMGMKKCPLVDIEENRKCMEPPCAEEELVSAVSDPECPTTEWSGWSPCSASCGRGVRHRTRLLLVPAAQAQACAARVELMQQQPCSEQERCDIDMLTAKRICMEEASVGPCRALYQRWAFSAAKGMCAPFYYGGCRGNRNNFLTQQDCTDTCSVLIGGGAGAGAGGVASLVPAAGQFSAAVSSNYPGLSVSSIVPLNTRVNAPVAVGVAGATGAAGVADCVTSAWGEWSRCSVSCGVGYQERARTVTSAPGPGGAPCPARLTRRRRCSRPC